MKKGTTVWKEKKRGRSVSTAAEVSTANAESAAAARKENDGSVSAGEPSGGASSAPAPASDSASPADQQSIVTPSESSSKTLDVDTMLLRFLVGKGGSTKDKIQKDCGVKLKVPSTHEAKTSKSGCSVVITGSAAGIEAAEKQIKAILDEAVQSKLQYTHFISLPLATHPDLLEQVEKFQERILARNQQTSSSGESSVSDEDKVDAMDTEKGVSEEESKSPKAANAEVEKGLNENGATSPEAENLEKKEKGMTEREIASPKAATLDAEKKVVTGSTVEDMDVEKVVVVEEGKSLEADIMNLEKGILEEEKVCKEEVLDMEKGVTEEAKTAALNKSGIDKSIFVKPRTFHLTVLMLKLWNEERVQAASEVLEKTMASVHEALEGKPVVLDIQGVQTMKGKREKAHVLFARVENSAEKDRLMQACQVLIDAYVESGLVMEKDIGQPLKLHATLMNTTHRTVKKNLRFGKRIPFDATEILEQYGQWKWGEFAIQEAHLSQRFVYGENGYYHCVKSIPLPGAVDKVDTTPDTGSL
ncbi:activating signal cointegrator complex subunit 1 [Marchantia polymorpha subsp. ruderalis]|uniref:K Homology domain-containing protein n=1 Tax=Marchantia polymorpha TaxID=3197 RepID=A0A2R6WCG2_MARPO|nr:hypothetical protein MARPO_0110s0022 [Marchantia polymorpha]BBN19762.1 hypothetical protein Mp_8g13410 [Marchantia polymorpha subsp. ruderalis]|eukprot:PTQ31529.1 hypothetical protein MARPO_0110s0022 [Marchantia polymorpha]